MFCVHFLILHFPVHSHRRNVFVCCRKTGQRFRSNNILVETTLVSHCWGVTSCEIDVGIYEKFAKISQWIRRDCCKKSRVAAKPATAVVTWVKRCTAGKFSVLGLGIHWSMPTFCRIILASGSASFLGNDATYVLGDCRILDRTSQVDWHHRRRTCGFDNRNCRKWGV